MATPQANRCRFVVISFWPSHTQRKPQGKFFIPVTGFVVKSSLARPWAPPPIDDYGSGGGGIGTGRKVVENAPAGTKVFVNLCGHEGVSPPIDQVRRQLHEQEDILSPESEITNKAAQYTMCCFAYGARHGSLKCWCS